MSVSNLRDALDVHDLTVRVAERLDIESFRVLFDCILKIGKNKRIHEGRLDAVIDQSVGEKVVGAAVDVLCGNDMIS